MRDSKALVVWLWASVVVAVVGAVLLYPIGSATLDLAFVTVKIGMVAGLVALIRGRGWGFGWWVAFSVAAVAMTCLKWAGTGVVQPVYVLAIIADVLMPLVAWRLMGQRD